MSKSDRMRALFVEGKTVTEVARTVGVGYPFAYGVAKRAGFAGTAANRRSGGQRQRTGGPRVRAARPSSRPQFRETIAAPLVGDLARAREGFSAALAHFREHEESGWHARVLHNFATSLSNLGATPEDLSESVALFRRALAWRTPEREIARGVTLHNLGLALRRLAERDRARAGEHLEGSAAALREAADIRARHGLAEGHALSLFHLGLTLEALDEPDQAVETLNRAAEAFERLGKTDSAAIARERAGV